MYILGSCTVKAHYAKKSYDFILTTLQAAVLLTFNQSSASCSRRTSIRGVLGETEELTLEEIRRILSLQEEDALRTLHSLACGRYKILHKIPDDKTIKKSDNFKVNVDFHEKMMRIRVPVPLADERRKGVRKVFEDVDKDRSLFFKNLFFNAFRRFAVDAAIVRTMKSRRVLKYQQVNPL